MQNDKWTQDWIDEIRRAGRRDRRPTTLFAWWLIPLAFIAGSALYGWMVTHPTAPGDPGLSPRQAQDS